MSGKSRVAMANKVVMECQLRVTYDANDTPLEVLKYLLEQHMRVFPSASLQESLTNGTNAVVMGCEYDTVINPHPKVIAAIEDGNPHSVRVSGDLTDLDFDMLDFTSLWNLEELVKAHGDGAHMDLIEEYAWACKLQEDYEELPKEVHW